jgi:phosphoglycolate phosphatase
MLQAVIFDLDGTLVDTAPDLTLATNHVLVSAGLAPTSDQSVRTMVGRGARMLITRGFAAQGVTLEAARLEQHYVKFVEFYSKNICTHSRPFPGAVALLERCAQAGLKLGICTNKLEGLSVQLIEALGLSHRFGAIVGADSIGIAKPDPAPYRETLRRLGVEGASIMVGDSETDILTARAAGVPVIGVSFGYTPRPVVEYGPDHIVDHFNEIWPVLESLRKG